MTIRQWCWLGILASRSCIPLLSGICQVYIISADYSAVFCPSIWMLKPLGEAMFGIGGTSILVANIDHLTRIQMVGLQLQNLGVALVAQSK